MRRAKIVCTLGPATSTPEQIRDLVVAGMDIARLNLSHGEYAVHEGVYRAVRAASDETGRAVGVLVDLQGPKIRTGRFAEGPVTLVKGDRFTITTDDVLGDRERVGTTYKGMPGDVKAGDLLLVDDGKVCLRAVEVTATDIVTETVEGGVISNNKGINLPGVAVSVPAMSEKDIDDLRWGLRLGADLIALSFVRSAADLQDVHRIMDEEGIRRPVIAKIEKPQAVDNLEEIINAFDGVMVARGDLGVELPLEDVPLVQKRAVEIARQQAKPVIVATQVLESMIENSRPTRAEASDCANAVLDGADAIMLSGETSVGAWPTQAVRTMARIIETTEDHGLERIHPLGTRPHTTGGAVTWAAVRDRRAARREVPRDVHPVRRLGEAALPHPVQAADAGLHAAAGDPLAAGPRVGHRDVHRPHGPAHRPDGARGRQGAAVVRPLRGGRPRHHRRGLASRHPRVDQRPARAPDR